MDKKEYVFRQLSRTNRKKDEHYVVSRIVHLLDDLSIKFVTQQHVRFANGGRALTDLYFPQFGTHVEVDEPAPYHNESREKARDADIVSVTKHDVIHIDTGVSLKELNAKIDEVVGQIAAEKTRQENEGEFIPWDIEKEHDPMTYLARGYIDIHDDVAFKYIKDACNCFGHKYEGYQRASATHRDVDTILWFPKLYEKTDWDNRLSFDGITIVEKCKDEKERVKHVVDHLDRRDGRASKRITFARAKDPLGSVMYRFKGVFELNRNKSSVAQGLIWERVATRVNTYSSD